MRRIFLLIMLLVICDVSAQRKKVGLVLGGGGAKGAAHVGVLRVLEEARIPVDYIAGTSIGAIVGGLYAAGYSVDQLDSLVHHMDWKLMLSDQVPQKNLLFRKKEREAKYLLTVPFEKQITIPAGVITGQNILNLFSDLTIGYHDMDSFDDLPIPFRCVATDLSAGKPLVFSDGSLAFAMRSSMSIPGVFMPVIKDTMVLVDGGVMNNLPTNVVKAMGADITIGVDLSGAKIDNGQLMTFNGMLDKLIDMMGITTYENNKKALDLCLNPNLKGFGTMSFTPSAIDSLYISGIEEAQAHMPEILALKARIYEGDTVGIPQYEPVSESFHTRLYDTIHIGRIHFDSVSFKDSRWYLKETKLRENSTITVDEINKAIGVLEGLDMFSSITYRLSDEEPCDLTFILKKKALNQLNVGFRFDTESLASILLNTTFSQKLLKGGDLSVTAKLDKNPYMSLGYNWGPGFMNKVGGNYQFGYHNFNLDNHRHRIENIYFMWQSAELKYLGVFKNLEIEAGMEWNYFGYSNELYNPDYEPIKVYPESFFNYYARLNVNAYDNKYYPERGFMGKFEAKLVTDNCLGYEGDAPIGILSMDLETVIRFSDHFSVLPSLTGRILWGDKIPSIYQNYMGGSLNARYLPQQIAFPGIRNIQLFEDALGIARLLFRFRIYKKHFIFAGGDYAKQAPGIEKIFQGDDIWSTHVRYGFDSPIGPISFQISYSNWVERVVLYANLGYYF